VAEDNVVSGPQESESRDGHNEDRSRAHGGERVLDKRPIVVHVLDNVGHDDGVEFGPKVGKHLAVVAQANFRAWHAPGGECDGTGWKSTPTSRPTRPSRALRLPPVPHPISATDVRRSAYLSSVDTRVITH
jgi:hypothetical protein